LVKYGIKIILGLEGKIKKKDARTLVRLFIELQSDPTQAEKDEFCTRLIAVLQETDPGAAQTICTVAPLGSVKRGPSKQKLEYLVSMSYLPTFNDARILDYSMASILLALGLLF
jgi:hypothetical protein